MGYKNRRTPLTMQAEYNKSEASRASGLSVEMLRGLAARGLQPPEIGSGRHARYPHLAVVKLAAIGRLKTALANSLPGDDLIADVLAALEPLADGPPTGHVLVVAPDRVELVEPGDPRRGNALRNAWVAVSVAELDADVRRRVADHFFSGDPWDHPSVLRRRDQLSWRLERRGMQEIPIAQTYLWVAETALRDARWEDLASALNSIAEPLELAQGELELHLRRLSP